MPGISRLAMSVLPGVAAVPGTMVVVRRNLVNSTRCQVPRICVTLGSKSVVRVSRSPRSRRS